VTVDAIFASVVGVLAGLAVVGALVFVLVWEWCAIRHTLANHRRSTAPPASSERDHPALMVQERRP
jgi:hypothetical protein